VSTLLVASTGGHLKQLHELRDRLEGVDPDWLWVTFDSPQSRSLLAGEQVVFARRTSSRDVAGVLINQALAARLLDRKVRAVVSTGAAVALSFIPIARTRGIPCHFIESATRGEGPSLTGRLLSRLPGVHLYTQHRSWAGERWRYAGSVFDGFRALEGAARPLRRVVVTLGTSEHGFPRLIDRLTRVLPDEIDVLWQTGLTDVRGLGIRALREVPPGELMSAMRQADVVVAHAGTGAALSSLEAGKIPVLVPRRAAFGEHVDDHQGQIARDLANKGLALARDAADLRLEDLERATGLSATGSPDHAPFRLVG
jgi:UDP-N-acetylglucosamine--N-acetylmuramyl-(pentapeptide) pyrophosphoryl-undecaprenol N-acetylglucosamine transferase